MTSPYVYHYTKATTALDHILPLKQIRLARVDSTNDPWEIRRQSSGSFSFSGRTPTQQELDEMEQLIGRVHTVVQNAQRGSFSLDDETAATEPRGTSATGWARDRMWAQYADNHQGVCLRFDRAKLETAFRESLAPRGDCWAEPVAYTDEAQLAPIDLRAAAADFSSYADRYRKEHVLVRYFRKRRDWASEREFRLLLLDRSSDGADALVPIARAIVDVIVGCRFHENKESQRLEEKLGLACEALEIRAHRIVYDGNVFLNPHGPPSLDRFPTEL
jgi:hypothetical protein